MDPVKLIKQDHRTVKSLFRSFERADRPAEKQKIAEEIIEELSIHAVIEEQLVYPVLREAEGRRAGRVLKALEEHHSAKLLLAELDKMKVEEERYDAKMRVVRQTVEAHIKEEETILLPRLDKMLGDDVRSTLAEAMIAARRVAPNHPHPAAPDTPPAGMITGLFAKVIDAGKDMVRKVTSSDKAAGHLRVIRRAKTTAASVVKSGDKAVGVLGVTRRAKATASNLSRGARAAGLLRVTTRARQIAGKVTRRRRAAARGTAQAPALKQTGSQRRRRSK
jgi:hemerythrin superfamily protein